MLATSNCELYSLSRTHLRRLLQDFPEFEGTLRKVRSGGQAVARELA